MALNYVPRGPYTGSVAELLFLAPKGLPGVPRDQGQGRAKILEGALKGFLKAMRS